jgi:hypothetical protein
VDWMNDDIRFDLISSLILLLITSTYVCHPTKAKYREVGRVWIIFIFAQTIFIGLIVSLFLFRIIPVILTPGIDVVYWTSIAGIYSITTQVTTNVIATKLKLRKNAAEIEDPIYCQNAAIKTKSGVTIVESVVAN